MMWGSFMRSRKKLCGGLGSGGGLGICRGSGMLILLWFGMRRLWIVIFLEVGVGGVLGGHGVGCCAEISVRLNTAACSADPSPLLRSRRVALAPLEAASDAARCSSQVPSTRAACSTFNVA